MLHNHLRNFTSHKLVIYFYPANQAADRPDCVHQFCSGAKYLSSLYSDVSSLYRLDQIRASASGLGPLPGVSKALLIGLAVCWVGMGTYVLSEKLKKRRKKD